MVGIRGWLSWLICRMEKCLQYTSYKLDERLGEMVGLGESLLEVFCEKLF